MNTNISVVPWVENTGDNLGINISVRELALIEVAAGKNTFVEFAAFEFSRLKQAVFERAVSKLDPNQKCLAEADISELPVLNLVDLRRTELFGNVNDVIYSRAQNQCSHVRRTLNTNITTAV